MRGYLSRPPPNRTGRDAGADEAARPAQPSPVDGFAPLRRALATALPDRRRGEVVRDGLATPGEALDPWSRDRLEQVFGQDLGHVRVHADHPAAESARRARARAYTVGSDVVFGAGRYRPHDPDGWRLLSHEMAHVATRRGELPLLAVTEKMTKAQRTALRALVAGKAEIVYLPEAAITKVSGRLARSLGIR